MSIDMGLTDPNGGACLAMGNHALARAIVETGTRVITSYPGSPTPEIGTALMSIPKTERNFYFENSINEKVALEIAAGASLNGHLSCVFFKSVGLNVASDSLVQQSLMNHIGGLVIILGDDPGANSSQNEQDNRHFARMSYIPMFEPASPAQAYEMYLEAAKLAKQNQCAVFIRVTTHVCHGRQRVKFNSYKPMEDQWESKYHKNNGPYFPVTESLFPLKRNALKKLARFQDYADHSGITQEIRIHSRRDWNGCRLGVISAGLPCMTVIENWEEIDARVDILKLGMTYPLPTTQIELFLKNHDEVLIVEELDQLLEYEIKSIAFDSDAKCKLFTRRESELLMGELTKERTFEILHHTWPEIFTAREKSTHTQAEVVNRIPQLCPGCGHRSAFFALKSVLPENAITVGDIGCLTLGALPPFEIGEVLFSMGHSVSTGAGLALNNNSRPVVAVMGDSTFFHAGLPGVINGANTNANVTLYLLDNGTTAMTGHQLRVGTGEEGPQIPIPALLEQLGVSFIRQSDAYNQAKLKEYLLQAFEHTGFSVVIAKHPCMLQFNKVAKQKNPSFRLPPIHLDGNKCDKLHTCISDFGCPSFERDEDGSIRVNEDLCIGCGSCIPVCPAGALTRKKRE